MGGPIWQVKGEGEIEKRKAVYTVQVLCPFGSVRPVSSCSCYL